MGYLGWALVAAGCIGALVYYIQILIMAFKTSTGWGVGVLLLAFPMLLIYVAKNWPACKKPFLRMLASDVLLCIGWGLTIYAAISSGLATGVQP